MIAYTFSVNKAIANLIVEKLLNDMMKVHIFSICWNEEFILPYYFKHYKQRFKNLRFTIYDNMSTDRSRELILSNGGELIEHDTNGEIRDDLYLHIKNNCWKQTDADWVIVCDVDEWLECNDEFLENVEATIIKTKGYDMVGNTYKLDKIKRGAPNRKMDKMILFKPAELEEINYSPGAHKCDPLGNVNYSHQTVLLYHMKYFKPSYLIRRYKLLAQRLSMVNKENKWGLTYTKGIRDILLMYLLIRRKSMKIRLIDKQIMPDN